MVISKIILLTAIASIIQALSGCSAASGSRYVDSQRIESVADLLMMLSHGFNKKILGGADFYREKIGYELTKFPVEKSNPREFEYGLGEVVAMQHGELKGKYIVLKKYHIEGKKNVLNIGFDTPGCMKKWQVEQIFMRSFSYMPDLSLRRGFLENYPVAYRIFQEGKGHSSAIQASFGARDGCLLNIGVIEIYEQEIR